MNCSKEQIACLLLLGCLSLSPVQAQSQEITSEDETDIVRPIADPEQSAPPRQVPLEESLPVEASPELLKLDLMSAMRRALISTPTLAKIDSKIKQAEHRVQEAYSPAYPRVDFSAQYSRVEPPVSLPNGTVISPPDNYLLTLNLRQAIYTFGRLKYGVLSSRLAKRVVEEEYRGEVNRLVLLVAQRYIEALLAQERVVIAQDELEAQLANLRISRLLFEQGVAAQFDVLRNSSASAQAEQTLIEAETSQTLSKARLLSLLDEPLERPLELDPLPLFAPNESIVLGESKRKALETRPDLRGLRWAVEQAQAQVEVVDAANNPTLDLDNTTTNRNATGFSPGTQNTTTISFDAPIYDGGVTYWQRKQALESVNQLTFDLEQAERDAVLQIEESFRQLSDRWRAIEVARENVTQADEALRVAVLRYQNGISTNVELLESQAARSQARFSLAQARGNYLASRWTWWQAVAGTYPVEVPFPEGMVERLQAESIPNGEDAFSENPTGEELGPIRGLTTPESPSDASSPTDSPELK